MLGLESSLAVIAKLFVETGLADWRFIARVMSERPAEITRLADQGRALSEIAVLFRTNGQSEACESALTQAGVPYLVRGGERFFSRQEVKQAVVLLRGAARSDDGSVPMPTLARDVITAAGWSADPPNGGAARERWESLNALAGLADTVADLDARSISLKGLVADRTEVDMAQAVADLQSAQLAVQASAKVFSSLQGSSLLALLPVT